MGQVSIIPIGIKGLFVPGIAGVRRLPLSCHVGDWTHYEWIVGEDKLFKSPPIVFQVCPRQKLSPKQIQRLIKKGPVAMQKMVVWTFHAFPYYWNGSLYFGYRRTR